MNINQDIDEQAVTVEPPLKQFWRGLSVVLALFVFGYLIFFSPIARQDKSQTLSSLGIDSVADDASEPIFASDLVHQTINEQANSALSADTNQMLVGSGREDDITRLRILKIISLGSCKLENINDEIMLRVSDLKGIGPFYVTNSAGFVESFSSLDELERAGFLLGDVAFKVTETTIDEQVAGGSVAGHLQLFGGSHTYLLLDLTVTPGK